jgi:cholesterol oxidase
MGMSETHFDAVIVGSGFGGSVMTYRLAKEGLRVCLLERGKPYPPTSFPRSPLAMKKNFWNPSEGLYGMYNVWSFQGINSIVSSGLGGGSLIYANVLLRKDEKWFVKEDLQHGGYEYWPVTRADLEPHYDRVEAMLNAQTYPFDKVPYNATSKTRALQKSAAQLGLEKNWFLPKLAVTFKNGDDEPVPGEPIREEPNLHGHTRYTCRLCGECDIGCNYGSKNSLDYNYLSQAKLKYGADIRTCCEVRSFEPEDHGGYRIHYVVHDPATYEGQSQQTHDQAVLPLHTITADRLILAAGTFGTTYLLLKNRAAFPRISKLLGSRFSGNGDLINFAVRCRDEQSGKREPLIIDGGHGPVITCAIRFADHQDGVADPQARGFYIEDAGYPEFVNWMLQVFDAPDEIAHTIHVAEHLLEAWVRGRPETNLSRYVSQVFGSCDLSACLLPILGMGRDIPNGNMRLNGDMLELDWTKSKSSHYFNALRQAMECIAKQLGATFVDDPIWYLNRVITVHPLGGCPMGRNKEEGVVDAGGQVFGYEGLYIADGSVMPGPVGANPSLTIAALADRFADGILEKRKERSGE